MGGTASLGGAGTDSVSRLGDGVRRGGVRRGGGAASRAGEGGGAGGSGRRPGRGVAGPKAPRAGRGAQRKGIEIMDPNAAWLELMDAFRQLDWDRVHELADGLLQVDGS